MLLSYHSLKLRESNVRLSGDIPALKVPIRYSGVFFAPRPGQILSKAYSEVKIIKAEQGQLRGKAFGLFAFQFPWEGQDQTLLSLDEDSGKFTWRQRKREIIKGDSVHAEVLR